MDERRQIWEALARAVTSDQRSVFDLWFKERPASGHNPDLEILRQISDTSYSCSKITSILFDEVAPALLWCSYSPRRGWMDANLDKLYVWINRYRLHRLQHGRDAVLAKYMKSLRSIAASF